MTKQVLASICALMLLTASLPAHAQSTKPVKPEAGTPTAQPASLATAEVDKFAAAIKQMLKINETSESLITQAIKSEGFNEQRFDEIYKSEQDAKVKPSKPVTTQEKQGYDRAVVKIIQIQKDNEMKMEKAVTAQGLDIKRFNEIFDIVQKDPDLQKTIKQKVQS
jgi:Domain of unknown function (DUF4168)